MTHEEFVDVLIEKGWKMDAFGCWEKEGGTAIVRFRGDEVNFGIGWVKVSDCKLSDDRKKIVWNGR